MGIFDFYNYPSFVSSKPKSVSTTSTSSSSTSATVLTSTQRELQSQAPKGSTITVREESIYDPTTKSYTKGVVVEDVGKGEILFQKADLTDSQQKQFIATVSRQVQQGTYSTSAGQIERDAIIQNLNYTPAYATPSPFKVITISEQKKQAGYSLKPPTFQEQQFEKMRKEITAPENKQFEGGYSYEYILKGKDQQGKPISFGYAGISKAITAKPMEYLPVPNPQPPAYRQMFKDKIDIPALKSEGFEVLKYGSEKDTYYSILNPKPSKQLIEVQEKGLIGGFLKGVASVPNILYSGTQRPIETGIELFESPVYLSKYFFDTDSIGEPYEKTGLLLGMYVTGKITGKLVPNLSKNSFVEPRQLIEVTGIKEIGKTEGLLGKAQISEGLVKISESTPLSGSKTALAAGEAKGVIVSFEKPIKTGLLVEELSKPQSKLTAELKEYTGQDITTALKELSQTKKPEVSSFGIAYDLKGISYLAENGKVTNIKPISGGGAKSFLFPEENPYNINQNLGLRIAKASPIIESLSKQKIEYGGYITKKGDIIQLTKGDIGSVTTPKNILLDVEKFHTHPSRFDTYLGRIQYYYSVGSESKIGYLEKLKGGIKEIYANKKAIKELKSYQPSIIDVDNTLISNFDYGIIGTGKGILIYQKPISGRYSYLTSINSKYGLGQLKLSELKELGLNPKIIPYAKASILGQTYQSAFSKYAVGKNEGILAAKTKFLAETPQVSFFKGLSTFAEQGKVKGRISSIIKIERISEAADKGKPTPSIRYFDVPTSSAMKNFGIQEQFAQTAQKATGGGLTSGVISETKAVKTIPDMVKGVMVASAGIAETKQTSIQKEIKGTIFETKSKSIPDSIVATTSKATTNERSIMGIRISAETKSTSESKQSAIPILQAITGSKQLQNPITRFELADEFKQLQQPITRTEVSQKQRQIPLLDTQYKQLQQPIQKQRTGNPLSGFGIEIPKPIISLPTDDNKKKQSAIGLISETGWNVYARSAKQFQKLNSKPLSRYDALNLGASATDNSAAATFKIEQTNKAAQPSKLGGLFANLGKFDILSKTPRHETYRERNTYRIDTQGEIMGISAKGWVAKRKKGNKSFLKNYLG